MLAILQDHLSQTQSPEAVALYEAANDLFDKFDLEDYQLGYEDLLVSNDSTVSNAVTATISEGIYNLTMTYLRQITTEHQITLSAAASMRDYIEVLDFVRAIEGTELVQDCLDALLCDDMDNLDKFARCMQMVCDVQEEDSMLYLEEIPDCVIRVMAEYFQRRVDLEVQTESLDPETKAVYRELDKFARVIKGQAMRSYRFLFEDEGAIGLPFEYHYKQNEAYLAALTLQAFVYECIGFALVSEGGLSNPQQVILDCVGKTVSDLEQITRVQYEISKALIEYRNEVSSGVGLVI